MADKTPDKTYTLEEFIEAGLNDQITYNNFSLLENISNINIPTENVIFDYMDELDSAAVTVRMSEIEFAKYKYKPKLLAYDLYGSTESYFIIMALNNIIDVRDFTLKKLKLLQTGTMNTLLSYIYEANTSLINANRDNL